MTASSVSTIVSMRNESGMTWVGIIHRWLLKVPHYSVALTNNIIMSATKGQYVVRFLSTYHMAYKHGN